MTMKQAISEDSCCRELPETLENSSGNIFKKMHVVEKVVCRFSVDYLIWDFFFLFFYNNEYIQIK